MSTYAHYRTLTDKCKKNKITKIKEYILDCIRLNALYGFNNVTVKIAKTTDTPIPSKNIRSTLRELKSVGIYVKYAERDSYFVLFLDWS